MMTSLAATFFFRPYLRATANTGTVRLVTQAVVGCTAVAHE